MYALSSNGSAVATWAPPANDPAERQVVILQPDSQERDFLKTYLSDHGYGIHLASHGRELEAILKLAAIDIIVVQAGPAADAGLDLCRRMAGPALPCLIVAGDFDATDRILALELGADDYLAMPFNPRELLARIRAVLRRRHERAAAMEPGRRFFLGFRFDFGSQILRRVDGSAPVNLTPGEFALLSAFVSNPGRVLSREELLEMARGDAEDVFDRVIDVQVSRLRQKLSPYADEPPIRTHRHAGYQFVAQVS